MKISYQQTNDIIRDTLIKGNPASILRIDNTAKYIIECILSNKQPSSEFCNDSTVVQAGVFPTSVEYLLDSIYPATIDLMKQSDLLGFVDVENSMHNDPSKQFIYDTFAGRPIYSGHSILVMDPGAILGHASHVPGCIDPWTKYLKGKKVLVISTHAETIKYQWNRIEQIWGEDKDIIAPFELAGVIRSPFHPMMDDRQYPGCNSWSDTVGYIMEEMSKYDYDVLLSGATTSSPFYVDYAKQQGKIGIQTGGAIQIFFGILGYRWTKVDGYKGWYNMYNEHWMYPMPIDSAQKREDYKFLETNFAYW